MSRPELGTKCACASCAERFYDLNRSPAICPKCGAPQPPAVARAVRPARTNSASTHMSMRSTPSIAEEDAKPIATAEEDLKEDGDSDEDAPELEASDDIEVEPASVSD